MIYDQLYALTAKDIATAPVLQRRAVRSSAVQAAALINNTDDPLAQNFARQVTHVSIQAEAGAAQTVSFIDCYIVSAEGVLLCHLAGKVGSGGLFDYLNLTNLNVWLLAGETIRSQITFNAGAAANTNRLSVHSLIIPRANLQMT